MSRAVPVALAVMLGVAGLGSAGVANAATVLDTGFGTNGIMIDASLPGGGGTLPDKVAVQPDGRIVVAGTTTNYVPFVARYLKDGRPDTSFGHGGVARLEADSLQITGLAISPDGSIVVGGTAGFPSTSLSDMALARLTSNGHLDPSFAGSGTVRLVRPDYDSAGALAVGRDGSVVVAGNYFFASAPNIGGLLITRLTPTGERDRSFGANGEMTMATSSRPDVRAVAITPDGAIYAGGSVPGTSPDPGPSLLARVTASGQPDSAFGASGLKLGTDTTNSPISGLAVERTGSVLAADRISLSRVSQTGIKTSSWPYNAAVDHAAVAILSNGRIIVAGTVDRDPAYDRYQPAFFVARYQPDLTPDASFTTADPPVLDVDNGIAWDVAATPDGGAVVVGAGGFGASTVLARFRGPGSGYWMLGSTGAVHAFGAAPVLPTVSPAKGTEAIDLEPAAGGRGGYRILTGSGIVHAIGDAPLFPQTGQGSLLLREKAVSISATPSGKGYWVFTSGGRVRTYGDARSFGDMAGVNGQVAVAAGGQEKSPPPRG